MAAPMAKLTRATVCADAENPERRQSQSEEYEVTSLVTNKNVAQTSN